MSFKTDTADLRVLIGRFLLPYWKLIIILIVASVLAATLNSLYPLLLAPAMDVGLLSNPEPAKSLSDVDLNNFGASLLQFLWGGGSSKVSPGLVIGVTVALFILAGALAAIVEFGAHTLSASVSTKAYRDVQVALYQHLLDQNLGFFLNSRIGELSNRFIVDAGEAMTSVDFAVRTALQSALQVFIYGWLLFKTSPALAGATLVVSGVHLTINRIIGGRLRRSTANKLDAMSGAGSALQEGFTGIRVIKSFGAEAHQHRRFAAIADVVQHVTMRFWLYKNGETPLRRITDTLAIGLILLFAFRAFRAGDIMFQGFVLFMVVVRLTIAPISQFAQAMTRLQSGLGAARRVLELLQQRPALVDGQRDDVTFQKEIRLEGVTFGYTPSRPVLRKIDLVLRKGELLAVVGASGSGKSTLIDLILRLYDPQEGRITIDGSHIRDFRQSNYRQQFGVVSQESLLFNESIRDNIIFGRDTGNEADLIRAAEVANAIEFVDGLPEKFRTLVGDRGVRLSGGQRQRIAIARAIYAHPAILILDEATSALDSESERLVQQAIDRVLVNATAVVIAHRLSTILHADRIVVLDSGRVAAVGRHAELIASSALYARLCEMQFGSHSKAETSDMDGRT